MPINDSPSDLADASFRFEREEDLELYNLLERLIGKGAAQLFQDACYLFQQHQNNLLTHKVYLIGHLFRELEGMIFDVIKPLVGDAFSQAPNKTSKNKVLALFRLLKKNICDTVNSREEPKNSKADLVDATLKLLDCEDDVLAKTLKRSKLHKVAHRDGLSSAKEISKDLQIKFNNLVWAYSRLLHLYEASFQMWYQRIDALLKTEYCPKKLKSQLPRNKGLISYLFGKLENPKWFEGLNKQRFFDFNNFFKGEIYPQTTYLIKIADQRPQEVLDIMLSANTNDAWLLQLFCDAAVKMPPKQCEAWAKHLIEKISTNMINRNDSLMYRLPEFLLHLITQRSDVAFDLVSVVLDILPPSDDDKYEKFIVRMDQYHYQELLKEIIPKLATLNAKRTANMLADKLDRAIELGWSSENEKTDLSNSFWLPAIEDHAQNKDYYQEGAIAISLRKVMEHSIKSGEKSIDEWLGWLGERHSLIYQRMAIHLVRSFGTDDQKRDWLMREELFKDSGVFHEYMLLLRDAFCVLSKEKKEQFLAWIDAIPIPDWGPEDPELRERHQKYLKYRRLTFIEKDLPEEWKSQFETLKQEVEPEKDLDRLSFTSWMDEARWVEDKSPIAPEKIAELTPKQLVDYLLGEIPFDQFKDITYRGLEKAIEVAILENLEKYIQEIDVLKNEQINPLFIRGISSGLIKSKKDIPNDVFLDWMFWCVERPVWTGANDGRPYTLGHNDNKKQLLNFLSGCMKKKSDHSFDKQYRESIFKVIQIAMSDPDPDISEETLSSMDWHTRCINSVRGVAMETAFDYALWVLREKPEAEPRSLSGDLPEFKTLIEERLDPEKGPSPAVRTVFGLYLPQLCWMDKTWVTENLERIFPESEDNQLYAAAWETYLLYQRCYKDVYEPLKPLYEQAIESASVSQLPKKEEDVPPKELIQMSKTSCLGQSDSGILQEHIRRLASHYVLFYSWGFEELKESMLCRFTHNAHPVYQAEAIDFAGRLLEENNDLPPEIVDRLKNFFEWWEAKIAQEFPKGWEGFSHWFNNPHFEQEWKIKRIVKASRHTDFSFRHDKILTELFENYFETYPKQVLEVLENYIDRKLTNNQSWELDPTYQKAIPAILKAGHHHKVEEIRTKADALLGRLLSFSLFAYREIAEEKE